jgi:hypothetical protein
MRLTGGESYRRIKPVDISGVMSLLDELPWFNVHQGGTTPDAYGCDVVRVAQFTKPLLDLVDGLGLGGTLARAMLRRLKPRQCIPLHTDTWMPQDRDWRRFQVPLVSDNFVVMQWPDVGKAVWLEPGVLWEVRFDTPHEVVNLSDNSRIHLQIDVVDATI